MTDDDVNPCDISTRLDVYGNIGGRIVMTDDAIPCDLSSSVEYYHLPLEFLEIKNKDPGCFIKLNQTPWLILNGIEFGKSYRWNTWVF